VRSFCNVIYVNLTMSGSIVPMVTVKMHLQTLREVFFVNCIKISLVLNVMWTVTKAC
jgi:hypothetical protein